jgi:hypothetical protein
VTRCDYGVACPAGQLCDPASSGCHQPCAFGECSSASVCLNGACFDLLLANRCSDGSTCTLGDVCVGNTCVRANAVPAGAPAGAACVVDWDCAQGLGCRAVTPTSGVCTLRCGLADCPAGEVCQTGVFCEPPCDPTDELRCPACVDGICYVQPSQVQYCESGLMCEAPTIVCRNEHCYAPADVPPR